MSAPTEGNERRAAFSGFIRDLAETQARRLAGDPETVLLCTQNAALLDALRDLVDDCDRSGLRFRGTTRARVLIAESQGR